MNEPTDDLQREWREAEGMSDREIGLVIRLIHEKGNAFQEAVRARNQLLTILGMTIAFFLLLIAGSARWPLVGPGYGLIGCSGAVAATVTWMYHRRWAAPDAGMEMRLYCEQLLRYYGAQIRFLRSLNRWCAPPFCIGVALLGFGFWRHGGNTAWLIGFGILLPLWCWEHSNEMGREGRSRCVSRRAGWLWCWRKSGG